MRDRWILKNFWGVSASALGTYELLSYVTGKRAPTVSTYCAGSRFRRALIVGWALGLALHLLRHNPNS